jgi:glycosyltransferase involved in cell wall biosynthesis
MHRSPESLALGMAAAAGIPSIGTRNGGPATCIGDAGFVVDPASPDLTGFAGFL